MKLILCRFISEFLLRLPKGKQNYLDDLVVPFHFEDERDKTEMQSYGSSFLLEMGLVFKSLYVNKHDPAIGRGINPSPNDNSENFRIDIGLCLSVLLSSCDSAKNAAI